MIHDSECIRTPMSLRCCGIGLRLLRVSSPSTASTDLKTKIQILLFISADSQRPSFAAAKTPTLFLLLSQKAWKKVNNDTSENEFCFQSNFLLDRRKEITKIEEIAYG